MIGVLLLNFGEPERAERSEVVAYLERIFLANASLEGGDAHARARDLAERRAPGLIEEYEAIGGSPLNRQAEAQAAALQAELAERGVAARVYAGMQFTEPSIRTVAEAARADGATSLVALPVYPLCGASTTVAALASLRDALDAMKWEVPVHEVAGWHRHALYVTVRADGVRASAAAAALDLNDTRARLLFSAHGTPLRYLEEGNRYDRYVTESCAAIAEDAGVAEYLLGFQNHGNRPIEWTQPPVEDVVTGADADALVVLPLSFMHEQSETLAELDGELRELAESRGIAFHRVPVPHDDPRFRVVLADLVEAVLAESAAARRIALKSCRCRPGARCLNGE